MNYCIKINNQLSNENLVLQNCCTRNDLQLQVDNTKVLKEIPEFILNAGYKICNKSNMEIPEIAFSFDSCIYGSKYLLFLKSKRKEIINPLLSKVYLNR